MESLVGEIAAWSRRVEGRLDNVALGIDLEADRHFDMPPNGSSYLCGHIGQDPGSDLALDDRSFDRLGFRGGRLRLGSRRRLRGRL